MSIGLHVFSTLFEGDGERDVGSGGETRLR